MKTQALQSKCVICWPDRPTFLIRPNRMGHGIKPS